MREPERKLITWKDTMVKDNKSLQSGGGVLKEKKKFKKYERPVVTEEFLEDLTTSGNFHGDKNATSKIGLFAKCNNNKEPSVSVLSITESSRQCGTDGDANVCFKFSTLNLTTTSDELVESGKEASSKSLSEIREPEQPSSQVSALALQTETSSHVPSDQQKSDVCDTIAVLNTACHLLEPPPEFQNAFAKKGADQVMGVRSMELDEKNIVINPVPIPLIDGESGGDRVVGLDGYQVHSPEGDLLLSPKGDFEATTEYDLTEVIMGPREDDYDELESLTGSANMWSEALSVQRSQGVRGSHSDVCLAVVTGRSESSPMRRKVSHDDVKVERSDKELQSGVPVSADDLYDESFVPGKRRRTDEDVLDANIELIREIKTSTEAQKKPRMNNSKTSKRANSADLSPRFQELLEFLVGPGVNRDEMVTVSRMHCIKLLNYDRKDLPKFPPKMCIPFKSSMGKCESVKLPPLKIKNYKEKRTQKPLVVIGQNFNR